MFGDLRCLIAFSLATLGLAGALIATSAPNNATSEDRSIASLDRRRPASAAATGLSLAAAAAASRYAGESYAHSARSGFSGSTFAIEP